MGELSEFWKSLKRGWKAGVEEVKKGYRDEPEFQCRQCLERFHLHGAQTEPFRAARKVFCSLNCKEAWMATGKNECIAALEAALERCPNSTFVMSCRDYFKRNGFLSDKQIRALNSVSSDHVHPITGEVIRPTTDNEDYHVPEHGDWDDCGCGDGETCENCEDWPDKQQDRW